MKALKIWAAVAVSIVGLITIGCGKGYEPIAVGSDGRITGGIEANGSESFAKTIAAVGNDRLGPTCSASIYNDSYVITAAHCLEDLNLDAFPNQVRVYFGKSIAEPSSRVVRKAETYRIAPGRVRYSESGYGSDLAVIKFAGGLPPGYHAATLLSDASLIRDGANLLVAGYGRVDLSSAPSFRLHYYEDRIVIRPQDDSEAIIKLETFGGRSACFGDSGGPLYLKADGKWLLWGVTSNKEFGGRCDGASGNVSLPYWSDWIRKTVAELGKQAASKGPLGHLLEDQEMSLSVVRLSSSDPSSAIRECSGTIVSDSVVLTSAKCVHGKDAQALQRMKIHFVNQATGESSTRQVLSYRIPDEFMMPSDPERESVDGDLALVKFAGGLPAGYRAAALAPGFDSPYDGTSTRIVGSRLSKIESKQGVYNFRYYDSVVVSRMRISQVDRWLGQDTLNDIGGPAFATSRYTGATQVWGVASANIPGSGSFYTNITDWEEWITATMAEM